MHQKINDEEPFGAHKNIYYSGCMRISKRALPAKTHYLLITPPISIL